MLHHKYDFTHLVPTSYQRLHYMNLHVKFLYVLKFQKRHLMTLVELVKISLQRRDLLRSSSSNLHLLERYSGL